MAKIRKKRKTKHLFTQSIHPESAGIDIGAEELVCAIPADLDDQPVRSFPTFTSDLHALRDWLKEHGITTVAMESTGTYWIPTYDILQAVGIEVCLVNARHIKGVPGKKTDVCDAQWLQQLHCAGLLRASFRPTAEVIGVRQLVRHRSSLIKDASRHLQHMQKALTEMNLKLHHVFSDLDGLSAITIIEAIVAGERDPEKLWPLRDRRCRSTKEIFLKAMEADWQEAQLFILQQCYQTWSQTREAIGKCDQVIEEHMAALRTDTKEQLPKDPNKRRIQNNKNDLSFDIIGEAYRCYGVDLSTINGISKGTLTILMSEVGDRQSILENFRSAKAFSSWLGLCPDNSISGGKVLKSKTRRVVNRLTEALRLAAFGLGHANCALGDYCRRMKSRLGKAEGITAVAHKLSRLIYGMLQSKESYDEEKAFQTTAITKARRLKKLRKYAENLGMQLTPIEKIKA